MNEPIPKPPENPEEKLKIYFLPNLLTAGNLFCGFVALTKIVDADPYSENYFDQIQYALFFILLACIFDLFDGRVARMGGVESPFGREFDSLADLISFGVAPAFLVQRVVLADVFGQYHQISWFIASIYLLCGAFRLARFNCLAVMGGSGGKDFLGFPIPSAAGLVASLTLLIMHFTTSGKSLGPGNYVIAAVLIFLSAMMVSTVRYPSFKSLGLRSTSTFAKAIGAALFIGALVILREKILYYVLPAFFTLYLIYGFVRPSLSRAWRKEIEEEDDEHDPGLIAMTEVSSIFFAMLTGLGAGLLLSMPVGPVNLTILNWATRRGFVAGMLVGLGASSMELIYCTIAFTGFTQFFEVRMIKTSMEVFTFVFFLFLGLKFLRAQNLDAPTEFGATAQKIRARVDEKFQPESAFMTGFIRVMGNFGVLLFWIVLAANFLSRDLVADTLAAKTACIAGVALGINTWFCGLSFTASRQCGQFNERALLRMERFSGVCLLALGIAQGIHIAWQLAKHKI